MPVRQMSSVYTENRDGLNMQAKHLTLGVTFMLSPGCTHLVKASRGSCVWKHGAVKGIVVFENGRNLKPEKGLWEEYGGLSE